MYALFNDLGDQKAIDNSGFVEFVKTPEGFTALRTWDGRFVSQVPNQKGRFENVPGEPHALEQRSKFGHYGNVITSWVQPGSGVVYNYVCFELPA